MRIFIVIFLVILTINYYSLLWCFDDAENNIKQLSTIWDSVPGLLGEQTDVAKLIKNALDPLKIIEEILPGFTVIRDDIITASEAAYNLRKIIICSTIDQDKRKQAKMCQELGCINRSACIKEGIRKIIILLKPFISDFFVGYATNNGDEKQGLIFNIFDIINQPQLKKQVADRVIVMKAIVTYLEMLEKIIGEQHE